MVTLLIPCRLSAQSESAALRNAPLQEAPVLPQFRLGFFTGYGINYHHTTSNIFSCPDCGSFSNGTGHGFSFNVFGEVPFLNDRLNAVISFGYSERGGNFGQAITAKLPVLDPNTNKYVPLTEQHTFNANIPYLMGNIGARFQPLETIPVYVRGGFDIGFPLASSTTYTQTQQILSPSGVTYPSSNTALQDVGSGTINNLKTPINAVAALGYQVPISALVTAAPEIQYAYALTNAVSDKSWKISTLTFGVAL